LQEPIDWVLPLWTRPEEWRSPRPGRFAPEVTPFWDVYPQVARAGFVSIIPGYDDRHQGRVTAVPPVPRREGAAYLDQWTRASGDKDRLIYGFNELHERTEIEPTVEEADLYLRLTEVASEHAHARSELAWSEGVVRRAADRLPSRWPRVAYEHLTLSSERVGLVGFRAEGDVQVAQVSGASISVTRQSPGPLSVEVLLAEPAPAHARLSVDGTDLVPCGDADPRRVFCVP